MVVKLSKTESPFMACDVCGAKFSFVFIDSITEGDIYECEFCNDIKLKRYEQQKLDVMEYDN